MSALVKKYTAINWLLLIVVSLVNMGLLYIASHASWWWIIIVALLFSLTNNTLFSLLHEAVHGLFSPNTMLNCWAGRLAACWFPTSFTIQQSFHFIHHRDNRSSTEQFDVLNEQDVLWLKYAQWYSIYTGLYWLIAVCGVLGYAVMPSALRKSLLQRFSQQEAKQTGAESYLSELNQLPLLVTKLEVLSAFFWQIALFYLLDLSWIGWLSCYGSFAVMWSSLQYTDHAFTPLDTYNGAWNLGVPRWLRYCFLNYHLHLTHHQNPYLRWFELPNHAQQGPRFIDVWWACMQGPRKVADFPTFKLEKTT